jgi:hypothetical protein
MAACTNHHIREITALLKAGKWSFGRSLDDSIYAAMDPGPFSVTAFTRTLASELDAWRSPTTFFVASTCGRASSARPADFRTLKLNDRLPVRFGIAWLIIEDFTSVLYRAQGRRLR